MTLWIVGRGEVVEGIVVVLLSHEDLLPDLSVPRVGDVGHSDEVLGTQDLFSIQLRSVAVVDGLLKSRRQLRRREDLGDHGT